MANKVLLFDNVDVSDYFATWQESASSRLNAQSVPRRHGALISDAVVIDAKNISITGTLLSPDRTALGLRTLIFTLTELFSRLNKPLQLWDDRYVSAYKSKFAWRYIEGSALTAADFSLTFFCANPFWYKLIATDVTNRFGLNGTFTDFTNNIWINNFTLTNNGTFVAYPLYTMQVVSGILTKFTLRNLTLGRQFVYTANVAAGASLVVDVSNFTVTNNNVSDLINWSGDFVWLLAGANSMQITATTTGTQNFDAYWQDRFY